MVRRSFRIGLRVGLLGGLVAAVVKTVQSRRSSGASDAEPPATPMPEAERAAEWPPVQAPPIQTEPEVPEVQAEVDTQPAVRKAAGTKATASAKKAPARTRKAAAPAVAWVEPTGAVCPPSHPVKAKLKSRLYHLPGMLAYARTTPDRCYGSPEAAEAEGLTRAKR